jgi:hypothetical protein
MCIDTQYVRCCGHYVCMCQRTHLRPDHVRRSTSLVAVRTVVFPGVDLYLPRRVCSCVYALLSLWTDSPVNRSCLCFRRRQNTVLILHRPACDEAMNNSDDRGGMQVEQPFRVLIVVLPRFHNFCCDNSAPMVMCCGGRGGNNSNGCTSPAGREGRCVALRTQVFAPFGLCWQQWRQVSFPFLRGVAKVCWIGATSLTPSGLVLCFSRPLGKVDKRAP